MNFSVATGFLKKIEDFFQMAIKSTILNFWLSPHHKKIKEGGGIQPPPNMGGINMPCLIGLNWSANAF